MNDGLFNVVAASLRASVYVARVAGEMTLSIGHIVHCVHSAVRVDGGAMVWAINDEGTAWFALSVVLLAVAVVEIGWLAWKVVRHCRRAAGAGVE